MASRSTEEMTIKFLELYKDRPCLWDQFSEIYKNKNARDSALGELVSAMAIEGFGITEAKLKIKSLRATYSDEVAKTEKSAKSGCSTTELYVPNVMWLYIMKGIMEKGRLKRESKHNVEIASHKRTATSPIEVHDNNKQLNNNADEVMLSEVNSGEDNHLADISDVGTDGSSVQQNTSQSTATTDHSIPKRFRPRSKLQQIVQTACELKSLSAIVQPKKESKHDVFGKHVAAQLSKLSPFQAIMAVSKINAILTECRLKDLKDSTVSIYETYSSLSFPQMSNNGHGSEESFGQSNNSLDVNVPSNFSTVGVFNTVSEALHTLENSYSEKN